MVHDQRYHAGYAPTGADKPVYGCVFLTQLGNYF